MSIHPFSATALRKLIAEARKLDPRIEEFPEGWSICHVDPSRLVDVFNCLRLKPGYKLCAYQYREYLNGNGYIYALPSGKSLPAPRRGAARPPAPAGALPDLMQAVEGDGSPWSFMTASIFAREAKEWGAAWHGCGWSCHVLLGRDPWQDFDDSGFSIPQNYRNLPWAWTAPKPEDWRPTVEVDGPNRTVVFYTFNKFGSIALYKHTDRFEPDTYCFTSEMVEIANAGLGCIH